MSPTERVLVPARQFSRRLLAVLLSILMVATLLVTGQERADAVQTGNHGKRLVSANAPASWTPHVLDGYVRTFAEVGNLIVAGGNFSTVAPSNQSFQLQRTNIFAFQKGNGQISQTFNPTLNGEVFEILPTGDGQTVWVVGGFSQVNGQTVRSIVKLNVNTGQRDTSFNAPAFNGRIHAIAHRGDRLYVAGRFTQVGSQPRSLVAALDPDTGALLPDVSFEFSEPRRNGTLSVVAMDVTPDGSKMVVIGNFTRVNGLPRYQIAVLDLTTTPASVANWRTNEYDDACSASFQTYMRDVDISPDGTYFVVVTTGAYSGGYPTTLCDTAARWELSHVGENLQPTWVNYTGGDTLLSTAVTEHVAYLGGHQRWQNNPYRGDAAGPGAVEREGIAAVDTRSGALLSWNPGRDRGVGVYGMLATNDGLWIGSDTTRIGRWHFRARLAFMPLSSGSDMPIEYTGSLPGVVYSVGRDTGTSQQLDQLVRREFTGTEVTSSTTVPSSVPWRNIRGAFMVDGMLYTAWEESGQRTFRVHSFDGQSLSDTEIIDIHGLNTNVSGRSPSNVSNFANYDIVNARGMFYDPATGRLYFNTPQNGTGNPPRLSYRQFSPESNVVGAVRYNGPGNLPGLNWDNVRSMFLVGNHLYIADTNGNLTRWDWNSKAGTPVAGTNVVVSGPTIDGENWRARDAFVYVGEGELPPNTPPTASATVSCDAGECVFDGTGSSDPDGSIVSYQWDFGDDTTPGTGATVTHTYQASGVYNASLTVTDDGGATDTITFEVNVEIPNVPPTAAISAHCTGLECVFDGSGSSDPDGSIVSYEWDFGDGNADTGESVTHVYDEPGDYTVTLTVTDDDGDTGTATQEVKVFDPNEVVNVEFGAVAATNVNSTAPTVTVPASVEEGDVMVLVATVNSVNPTVTGPAGWTLLDSESNGTATVQTFAWAKTATASDAGSTVRVTLSSIAKTAMQLVTYKNAAGVGDFAVTIDTTSNNVRTTPVVDIDKAGSILVSYWADKSSDSVDGWQLPAEVTERSSTVGSGSGRVAAAIGDTGPLAPGQAGGYTATSDSSPNRRGVTWSIAIEPRQ